MNKTIRILQFFNRKIKFDNYFYNISIDRSGVTLQGYYNSNLVKELLRLKFIYKIDKSYGYIILERNEIKVLLT